MGNEMRRSGIGRRIQQVDVADDRRTGLDRRAIIIDSDNIISSMKNFPFFMGLSSKQYGRIINIYSQKTFPTDYYIYRVGDESDELFILIKGQLDVMFRGKALLARISPINLFGEIDIFSGMPRISSVITTTESTLISIHKIELLRLFQNDHDLGNNVLLNIVYNLAQKLREYSLTIEELRKDKGNL